MSNENTPIDAQTIAMIQAAPRVCFFAHYHPHGLAAEHVLIYLRALKAAGFAVVVLSTATMEEGERAKLRGVCALLIERANVGLDFGGWVEAYRRFAPLNADFLLLANDSVYAPFHDLGAFIDRLTATPADFYGAIESYEGGDHLQSWFLLLRPAAYRSDAFAGLMVPIPADMSKAEIIERYELGLTKTLAASGLRYRAAYSPTAQGRLAREHQFNPSHMLWRELAFDQDMPFLKIELLRDNPLFVANVDAWHPLAHRAAPALAQAIDDDLARRGRREDRNFGDRLRGSLSEERAALWPELHGFLTRDHRLKDSVAGKLNYRAFGLAEKVARRVRRGIARSAPVKGTGHE